MIPKPKLRIGIPIIGGKGWLGGVSYVELLARSQTLRGAFDTTNPAGADLSLVLIVKPETLESLDLHAPFLDVFEHVVFWMPPGFTLPASYQGGKVSVCHTATELYRHIDVYFPLPWDAWPGLCAASWLPDFQHRFLPEFFSAEERRNRDRDIGKVADQAPFIVLSSHTAEKHFRHFYPNSKAVTRVLSFYTLVEEAVFAADPAPLRQRYGLPERYLMCSNQFWKHKDHGTLFKALALCRDRGLDVHLACTGALEDYRHPAYMDSLRRQLTALRLADRVRILGTLPRRDQQQLMRGAMATVQPSLFEGWSTVVEDGRALGKLQFLSDLDVHREQAPRGALFFKAGDAEALASALQKTWPDLRPGPDRESEARARRDSATQVRAFGETFARWMRECRKQFEGHPLQPGASSATLDDVLREAARLFRGGLAADAEALLAEAAQDREATARLYNDLGVMRLALNRRSEALRAFAQALQLDIEHERAFENLWETLAIGLETTPAIASAESEST